MAIAVASLLPVRSGWALSAPSKKKWSAEATSIVKDIRIPTFPKRSITPELSPAVDARIVIQEAIDTLNRDGGGRVVIPKGTWNIEGPIKLKSNINLHLTDGATLVFSDKPEDYLPAVLTRWEGTEMFGFSPFVYALHATNIAITGNGTINGNCASPTSPWRTAQERYPQRSLREDGREGEPLFERVYEDGDLLRPSLIQFFGCSSILVEDITTVGAPFWGIHLVYSQDATIRRVTARSKGSNNDGVDVDSSNKVLIERCVFDTGDDCVAIKSGRDLDGRSIGRPSEDIVIRDCVMNDGRSAGVAFGSEMSGGIRRIYVQRCAMKRVETAINIKSNLDRGGVVEKVRVWDLHIGECETVFEITTAYHGYTGGIYPPTFRDVQLDSVSCDRALEGIVIKGAVEAPIEEVSVSYTTIRSCDKPLTTTHSTHLSLHQFVANNKLVTL
jgi:polygalacturonase